MTKLTEQDYTPTTDEVRRAWVGYRLDYCRFGNENVGRGEALDAEFDRWLAAHDAEAWDEGYRNGYLDRTQERSFDLGDNPYRARS